MAWATKITAVEQVEYRLDEACGCDPQHTEREQEHVDRQVDYRLKADLQWIGSGLADVGLVAGATVDKDAARALMDGRHPHQRRHGHVHNDRLVEPKMAVAPAARVAAGEYVAAIRAVAATAGVTPGEVFTSATAAARFGRLERGMLRDGDGHTIPYDDLARLANSTRADVAGVVVPALDDIYSPAVLAEAKAHRGERVRVDQRGTDVVLNLPKSVSALYAVVDPGTAAVIEAEYMAAVTETIQALEGWAAYGVAGHHGDGKTAARVESSGFVGWTMLHRTARAVQAGQPGDPQLHAHAVLAHMVHCADGAWRAPGSGGRDIYRHVAASGELVKARVRARLSARLGVRWERDPDNGEWEIAGVPRQLRDEFSSRSKEITAAAGGAGASGQRVTATRLARARTKDTEPADVRAHWRATAEAVVDVDAMIADVMPGPGPGGGTGPAGPGLGPAGPRQGPPPAAPQDGVQPSPQVSPGPVTALPPAPVAVPDVAAIAAAVWTGQDALTAHTKVVTRVQVLAAVAAACPGGVAGVAQLEALTDQVIAAGHTIEVPQLHASHHSNTARWTTRDIVEAEATVITAAAAQLDVGAGAVSPVVAAATVTTWAAQRGLILSGEQEQVVARLTTAGHGIDAVIGVAGAGKTTLMAAARAVWEDAGYSVAGASTAAVASAGLAAEAGITSRTIARWLAELDDPQRPGLADVDVLVIDEAAMVDDRALARLVGAAQPSPANPDGTKLVLIGDPLQLRAIGVGGTFQGVHDVVTGAQLVENRRQRDPAEREALQVWRDGGRRTALDQLAGAGRIHAVELPEQVHTEMLTAWEAARAQYAGDPHAHLSALAMLAARNVDVEALNAGARAIRIAAGELPPDTAATLYRRGAAAGGGSIALAPGDLVRVRVNNYRSREDSSQPDVLNGFRAVVTDVDDQRQVRIEWATSHPDAAGGHRIDSAWISPAQISAGHLTHGYAMTIAASQGMTCDLTLASGVGADAHALYPALTRARHSTHLWLARTAVEDDETTAVLGPATDGTRLARTIGAYAEQLEKDRPDSLISELLTHDQTAAHVRAVLTEARRQADNRHPQTPTTDPAPPAENRPPQPVPVPVEPDEEALSAVRLARTGLRPYLGHPGPRQEFSPALPASLVYPEPSPGQPAQVEHQPAASQELTPAQIAAQSFPVPLGRPAQVEHQPLPPSDPDTSQDSHPDTPAAAELPDAAQRTGQVPGWSQRPYGTVATGRLAAAIAAADQNANRAQAHAQELQKALHADPLEQSLARARLHLEAADTAVHDAGIHTQRAAQLDWHINVLRAANQSDGHKADIETSHGQRLLGDVLGRHARTAQELQTQISARTTQITDLRAQRQRAIDQARDLRDAAARTRTEAGARHANEPTEYTLARLTEYGRLHESSTRTTIQNLHDTAEKARTTSTGLQAETALRAGLSPATNAAEDRARTKHAEATAAARAAAATKATAEAARATRIRHDYRPPGPTQRGPSLGR